MAYLNSKAAAKSCNVTSPMAVADHTMEITITDTLLFRFSALSFNAHKIHINPQYARTEGYETAVAHGPLLVLLTLGYLRLQYPALEFINVQYRNTAPVFQDEVVTIKVKQMEDYAHEAYIIKHNGIPAMRLLAKSRPKNHQSD